MGKAMARARGGAMSGGRRLLRAAVPMLACSLLSGSVAAQDVVEYYELDSVGNVLVVTNAQGAVVEEHDYLPFGEELCGTTPCSAPTPGQPRRFTGKERDAETGLDYFGARYYQAKHARFTTVDPVYTWRDNLVDPQRWNRYAYGRNNPLRYVDPDGKVILDWSAFKGYVSEAASFGQEGHGYLVPTVAGLAAAGSAANDVLMVIGVGEVFQAVRGGLAAGSVARTGLGLFEGGSATGAPAVERAAGATATGAGIAKQGIYEFPDQAANNIPYVGQSGNIAQRLGQHQAAGRLSPGTASTTEVLGGKTAREVAEHRRIQEITGGVPARLSERVSNKVDPIGPNRQGLLN